MRLDKNTVIIALVLVCGILAGIALAGLIAPQPVQRSGQVIYSEDAPQPIGPYSQAVQSGDLVFLSGQIGIDPATGNLTGGVDAQTTRVMENLRAVLKKSGLGFGDVVSTRIYLVNISDGTVVNGIYASYFSGTFPARATVQVAGLPKGALVEIEMVAKKR